MNFEGFMDGCRRCWPAFDNPRQLAAARYPEDRRLREILNEVPGMGTENKLMLLNLAAAELAADEVYVEVGSYKGASLVGAAAGNPQAKIFACDNFSQFDGAVDELAETLGRFTRAGQVEFFNLEFREFLRLAPWRPAKVGAYFYDGGHSFNDQFDGLRSMLPWLADDALVAIDDTNKLPVRSANASFARMVPGFDLVLDLRTPSNHHPTWWNGIQVFRLRRTPATPHYLERLGPGFSLRRFIFDEVLLDLRHRRRALRRRLKRRAQDLKGGPRTSDAKLR